MEIYARPAKRFVADFIGRVNFLEGRVASIGPGGLRIDVRGRELLIVGDAVVLVVRPETLRLKPDNGGPAFSAIVRRVTYLGATVEYELD